MMLQGGHTGLKSTLVSVKKWNFAKFGFKCEGEEWREQILADKWQLSVKPVKMSCLNVTNVKWDCHCRTPLQWLRTFLNKIYSLWLTSTILLYIPISYYEVEFWGHAPDYTLRLKSKFLYARKKLYKSSVFSHQTGRCHWNPRIW